MCLAALGDNEHPAGSNPTFSYLGEKGDEEKMCWPGTVTPQFGKSTVNPSAWCRVAQASFTKSSSSNGSGMVTLAQCLSLMFLLRGEQACNSNLALAGQPKLCHVTGLPEVLCTCQPCGDTLDVLDTLDSTAHPCVGNRTEHWTSTGISCCWEPVTLWMLHWTLLKHTSSTWRSNPRLVNVCNFSALCSLSEGFTWRLNLPQNSKAALGKCLLFMKQKKRKFPLRFYMGVIFPLV